jgi:hypothetical protein
MRKVSADMDGIKALPTSHSIRAYLAVLYPLPLAVHVAAVPSPLSAARRGQRT